MFRTLSTVVVLALLLAGCGTTAPTAAPQGRTQSAETATGSAPSAKAPPTTAAGPAKPQVTKKGDDIVITGQGDGTTEAISLPEKYYVATYTLGGTDPVKTMMLTEKGRELPAFTAGGDSGIAVFRPVTKSVPLIIETDSPYTITLAKPPAITTAVATPKTFSGAAGSMVTPPIKIAKAGSVKLTYKGTANPAAPTGAMLALVLIYDATDGTEASRAVYVNKAKPVEEDSIGNKPTTVFAIIRGSTAQDPWECTFTG